MSSISKAIAVNVKNLCREQKRPLGKLEHEIGVSKGYFSRIKNGNTELSIDKLYKAAQILNISISDLCEDFRLMDIKKNAASYGYQLVPIVGEVK